MNASAMIDEACSAGMLDGRLENWGRAMLFVEGGSRGSVASLEGNYRSPQYWHWEDSAPKATPRVIDHEDAEVIEHAVCALELFDHLLLKGWYVRRWSHWKCLGVATRGSGLPRSGRASFDSSMVIAKAHLLAELDRPAVVRKARVLAHVRRILGTGGIDMGQLG